MSPSLHTRSMAIKEIIDWSMTHDFVDELNCHLHQVARRKMSAEQAQELTNNINELVAKAMNEVIYE